METRYAPTNSFYTSLLEDDLLLDKSRIKELARDGRESFVRYLEENPILAQEYQGKFIVIDGFHRTYVAQNFNLEQIPYILTKEFRDEDISELPLRIVREMRLAPRKEFREQVSKDPNMS